jgi:hypothetical protein
MSSEWQNFESRRAEPALNDPLSAADRSVGGVWKPVGSLVDHQSFGEHQADCCPYCRKPLEIVFVKFKFSCVTMIASCPNCAMANEWLVAKSKNLDYAKRLKQLKSIIWDTPRGMATARPRLRYVLSFPVGAVVDAAALRHGVHVYGGLSREEMRAGALLAIPIVALAMIFFQRRRKGRPPAPNSRRRF